jgi:hypothetical protein
MTAEQVGMDRRIRIRAGSIAVVAQLDETGTADAIWSALPIRGNVTLWGEEIYFPVSLSLPPEDARELVEAGDLGYWPQGPAFCIFFGPTPASRGQEIRPASPVNVFGRVVGDTAPLSGVRQGAHVTVERDL